MFPQHILALRLLQCMILTMHLALAGNKDMFDGPNKRNGTAFSELNPGALAGCATNSSTFSTIFTVRVGAWLHWHFWAVRVWIDHCSIFRCAPLQHPKLNGNQLQIINTLGCCFRTSNTFCNSWPGVLAQSGCLLGVRSRRACVKAGDTHVVWLRRTVAIQYLHAVKFKALGKSQGETSM